MVVIITFSIVLSIYFSLLAVFNNKYENIFIQNWKYLSFQLSVLPLSYLYVMNLFRSQLFTVLFVTWLSMHITKQLSHYYHIALSCMSCKIFNGFICKRVTLWVINYVYKRQLFSYIYYLCSYVSNIMKTFLHVIQHLMKIYVMKLTTIFYW